MQAMLLPEISKQGTILEPMGIPKAPCQLTGGHCVFLFYLLLLSMAASTCVGCHASALEKDWDF